MKTMFHDKPVVFPKHCPDGKAMKPLTEVLLDRRATSHFKPDAVPEEYLEAILQFAAQAPSGYNLQPWRFIVVREKENRDRSKKAAFNQEKVGEAPVVVIAFAIKDDWKNYIDALFDEGVRRGYGKPESVPAIKKQAADFLERGISPPVWLNRHTMIAVTTMMLMAEAYGLDTAPMEGFDPQAVGREFGLPAEAQIVACSPSDTARSRTNLMADGSHFRKLCMTNILAGAGTAMEKARICRQKRCSRKLNAKKLKPFNRHEKL